MNLESIKQRQKIILKKLKEDGTPPAIGEDADEAREILRSAFLLVFRAFPQEVMGSDLCYLGLYNHWDDPLHAGNALTLENADTGEKIRGIIVSMHVFDYDVDFLFLVLLHELAHVLSGHDEKAIAHDEVFEAELEELINEFNRIYGTHIVNDWCSYGEE